MSLIEEACARLAASSGGEVTPGEVYVDHLERVVFAYVDPAGATVVVKADTDRTRLAREAAALAAAAAGVPVPQVHSQADGMPAMLVLAYLPGEPLAQQAHLGWAEVGSLLRRLHDDALAPADLPVFGGGPTWWTSMRAFAQRASHMCVERGLLPPGAADRLRASVLAALDRGGLDRAGAEPPMRLLHGDCTPFHWLVRDGQVTGLIDFGDTGVGDPVWDVVVLTRAAPDRLAQVLDGYRAAPAFTARVRRLYEPYSTVRALGEACWLAEHGFDLTAVVAELTGRAS